MEQTTFNLGPYLLGGFVGIIIGWVIGFFDSNLRAAKKIKQAEESAAIAAQEAKDKIAMFEAKAASIVATPATVDDPGMMRIKNENGMLSLDLDGVRVDTFAMHPDQRKRLIEMLSVIRPWLEHKPAPATMTPPPPQPTQAPVRSAPPAPQPTLSTPAPTPATAPKKEDKPATAPTSMVGQINAILQLRIANTKFAEQGITMIELPSGGVYVYVGLNKFEGIDSVPDEEIKTVIRAAIAEWERKYTPGLS